MKSVPWEKSIGTGVAHRPQKPPELFKLPHPIHTITMTHFDHTTVASPHRGMKFDPRDETIHKLRRKIQLMDEQREVFRQSVTCLQGVISSLEGKMRHLQYLNEACEDKMRAFACIFDSMNGEAQDSTQRCPGAVRLADPSKSSDSSISSEDGSASCRLEL